MIEKCLFIEKTRPNSNRRMCGEGFKPLKKNEGMEGAGRKKKTRKKRGGEYSRLAKKLLKHKTRRKIKKTEPTSV